MEKSYRVLLLFIRLLKGERIQKANFAFEHRVTKRSVERDIQTIRNCIEEQHANMELLFDRTTESYYLSVIKHSGLTAPQNILKYPKEINRDQE